MSKASSRFRRQQGISLVLALLILLIMTIIGVSLLNSINMQERMAGNSGLQSLAFEAASSGISEALSWAFSPESGKNFTQCDRDAPWTEPQPWSAFRRIDLDSDALSGVVVNYRLRNECLEDPGFAPDADAGEVFEPPVQMYVTIEGVVTSADNVVLALRQIEVRIANVRGDGLSAIRIEGQAEVQYDASDSNRFFVDGAGGPAITTSTLGNASRIAASIGDDRIGNYDGGVSVSAYPPPFNSAENLAKFALLIKAYMDYRGIGDTNTDVSVQCPGSAPFPRTMRFVDGDLPIGNGSVQGITYVTGNFSAGGNASGQGLLIVEGEVDTNGTPDFDGMIIGLGGLFDMAGGGRGRTNGMIFATNLDLSQLQMEYDQITDSTSKWLDITVDMTDPENLIEIPGVFDQLSRLRPYVPPYTDPTDLLDYELALGVGVDSTSTGGSGLDGFGSTVIRFAGGGNHRISYRCEDVDAIRAFLASCTAEDDGRNARLTDGWASFGCNVPGQGAPIAAIKSWRENLGWRELLEAPGT